MIITVNAQHTQAKRLARVGQGRSAALALGLALAGIVLAPASPAAKDKKPTEPQSSTQLVWPSPPAPAKIKWVTEYRSEFDVGAKKRHGFVDRLAGKGEDALWLRRPLSVAVDDEGVMYVGDFGLGVVGIDPSKHRMWLFSEVAKRGFGTPAGVAVDSQMVYVCDSATNTFAQFDKEGHFLSALGPQEGVNRPVGVAVDEARDLVVMVNGGQSEVWLCNRQLKLAKKIGGRGEKPGQFNFPTYVCMVPGTGFAVVDTGNFRVQLFDYDGRFIRAIGRIGDVTGSFARPKGIAVDPDNNVYVADASFSNFQVFALDGQVLTYVGQGGADKGQFQVPTGLAISKDGMIYVADEMNARVQVFQYLGKGGGGEADTANAKK